MELQTQLLANCDFFISSEFARPFEIVMCGDKDCFSGLQVISARKEILWSSTSLTSYKNIGSVYLDAIKDTHQLVAEKIKIKAMDWVSTPGESKNAEEVAQLMRQLSEKDVEVAVLKRTLIESDREVAELKGTDEHMKERAANSRNVETSFEQYILSDNHLQKSMAAEREKLAAEREKLAAEREKLTAERVQLSFEIDRLRQLPMHESSYSRSSNYEESVTYVSEKSGQLTPTGTITTTVSDDDASNGPWENAYVGGVSISSLRSLSQAQLIQLDEELRILLRFSLDHVDAYIRYDPENNHSMGDLNKKICLQLKNTMDKAKLRYDASSFLYPGHAFQKKQDILKTCDNIKDKNNTDEARIKRMYQYTFPYVYDRQGIAEAQRDHLRVALAIIINLCYWRGIFTPE